MINYFYISIQVPCQRRSNTKIIKQIGIPIYFTNIQDYHQLKKSGFFIKTSIINIWLTQNNYSEWMVSEGDWSNPGSSRNYYGTWSNKSKENYILPFIDASKLK